MKPTLINLDDYVVAGEGANGVSYNHKSDPTIMLKIYFRNYEAAELELEHAQKVFNAGIPTPEPGDLITDGERLGIRFRRIEGKKSYARAVGDDPAHTEDYAREFAEMCKQLHQTELDTKQFRSVKEQYLYLLEKNEFFTTTQKQKISDFVKNAPEASTAIHGDLQFGNGIFVDKDGKREKYFIDLGDFTYGYKMFDLGMVYLTCKLNDEEFTKSAFHMDNATAARFWDAFAPAYFGPDADFDSIEKEIRIYAGLKTLIVERDTMRPMPGFRAMLEGTIY